MAQYYQPPRAPSPYGPVNPQYLHPTQNSHYSHHSPSPAPIYYTTSQNSGYGGTPYYGAPQPAPVQYVSSHQSHGHHHHGSGSNVVVVRRHPSQSRDRSRRRSQSRDRSRPHSRAHTPSRARSHSRDSRHYREHNVRRRHRTFGEYLRSVAHGFRKLFSFGPRRSRHRGTRTGYEVDSRGRKIYRL